MRSFRHVSLLLLLLILWGTVVSGCKLELLSNGKKNSDPEQDQSDDTNDQPNSSLASVVFRYQPLTGTDVDDSKITHYEIVFSNVRNSGAFSVSNYIANVTVPDIPVGEWNITLTAYSHMVRYATGSPTKGNPVTLKAGSQTKLFSLVRATSSSHSVEGKRIDNTIDPYYRHSERFAITIQPRRNAPTPLTRWSVGRGLRSVLANRYSTSPPRYPFRRKTMIAPLLAGIDTGPIGETVFSRCSSPIGGAYSSPSVIGNGRSFVSIDRKRSATSMSHQLAIAMSHRSACW